MTKAKATWNLWLKVTFSGGVSGWRRLCGASPGYYFSAREVLQTVADKWGWPKDLYRILPAGKVPR